MSEAASAIWWLYVLECNDGSLYTGIALNVEQRFEKHQAGTGGKYTRAHPPVAILASKAIGTRAEATRAERHLKGKTRADKLDWVRQNRYTTGARGLPALRKKG